MNCLSESWTYIGKHRLMYHRTVWIFKKWITHIWIWYKLWNLHNLSPFTQIILKCVWLVTVGDSPCWVITGDNWFIHGPSMPLTACTSMASCSHDGVHRAMTNSVMCCSFGARNFLSFTHYTTSFTHTHTYTHLHGVLISTPLYVKSKGCEYYLS